MHRLISEISDVNACLAWEDWSGLLLVLFLLLLWGLVLIVTVLAQVPAEAPPAVTRVCFDIVCFATCGPVLHKEAAWLAAPNAVKH